MYLFPALCGWLTLSFSRVPITGRRILQSPFSSVPSVRHCQQWLCRGTTKLYRTADTGILVPAFRRYLERRDRDWRRRHAAGAGNRLSCFDRAIYRTDRRFVSYGRKRTAGHALYPRHSGGKLAVFQIRCIVLPSPVVCGRSQAQNRKEPLHPCAASILPVCSDCRSVYDSILSVLRPVPVRTFKTGRLFS